MMSEIMVFDTELTGSFCLLCQEEIKKGKSDSGEMVFCCGCNIKRITHDEELGIVFLVNADVIK